jgi:hypothetical protein
MEFLQRGKPLRFYPAEMNHSVASSWFRGRGEWPVDFRGAAHHTWARNR